MVRSPAPVLALALLLPSTPALAAAWVVTDRATLDALSVPGIAPPVSFAAYLSGGSEAQGFSNPCDFGYSMVAGPSADALAEADLSWTQSGAQGILFELPAPSVSVVVLPSIDHGPFPNEGIEYTVWGSDTGDLAGFPAGWDLATLVTIYREGWVDSCPGNEPGDESDDFAGLYGFRDLPHRYVVVLPSGSITIFEDPSRTSWTAEGDDGSEEGWQSSDFEIDAVGVPVCDAGLVAVGRDVAGVAGEAIELDATGSLGTIATYGWDIDQDFAVDLAGAVVTHVFEAPGDYEVMLSVVAEDACSDFDTVDVHACAPEQADADGDGSRAAECGGDDCDDADPEVHPGAEEVDGDGVDGDCDGRDDVGPPPDDDTGPPGDDDAASADDDAAGSAPPAEDFEGTCGCGGSAGAAGGAAAALVAAGGALGARSRRIRPRG